MFEWGKVGDIADTRGGGLLPKAYELRMQGFSRYPRGMGREGGEETEVAKSGECSGSQLKRSAPIVFVCWISDDQHAGRRQLQLHNASHNIRWHCGFPTRWAQPEIAFYEARGIDD